MPLTCEEEAKAEGDRVKKITELLKESERSGAVIDQPSRRPAMTTPTADEVRALCERLKVYTDGICTDVSEALKSLHAALVEAHAERDELRERTRAQIEDYKAMSEHWATKLAEIRFDLDAERERYAKRLIELEQDRDRLAERVKELERDAERYRWLREKLLSIYFVSGKHDSGATSLQPCFDDNKAAWWDAAIDAAKKGEQHE